MNAIELYNSLSRPPANMLKPIEGGKLKDKTDINPQWRYRAMTEAFGLVGIGWDYEIQKLWVEAGAGGEVLCFAQVSVRVKQGDAWSTPIIGIGGSKLVQLEKGGLVSNDEGYKMVITDAFSTSLKMLGVASAIYEGLWDGAKYCDAPKRVQGKKKEFVPKGGEATAAERKRLNELFSYKHPDGSPVFSREDILQYSAMRKDKTAQELIDIVYSEFVKRGSAAAQPTSQEDIY